MNDAPERSQFESRLPEHPAYWSDLAARITESAEPVLQSYREADAWWNPLARWSPAIGVAAAAAAIVAVATIPAAPASATPPPPPPSLDRLLSPDDPVARAVVGGESAMNISTMLLVESGGHR
jgi:hypothetical protein